MVAFGGHLTAFSFLNYFARNGDNLLIGWRLGATPLGLYSKAYNLMMMPISQVSAPLSAVAVPALSRLKADPVRMGAYYARILGILATGASVIGAFCFALADEIVLVALGDQWVGAIAAFRFLSLGGMLQPLYNTQSWLHVASGNPQRVSRWGMVATPIIVGAFLLGIKWGIEGVAICYSIAILVLTCAALAYACRSASLEMSEVFRAVGWPLLACVMASGITLFTIGAVVGESGLVVRLVVGTIVFGLAYIGVLTKGLTSLDRVYALRPVFRALTRNGRV